MIARRALWLLLCLGAACGTDGDRLRLGRPVLLQALEVPVTATLEVYEKAGRKGERVERVELEPEGDGFAATVRLRPGTYYFNIGFTARDDGGDLVLGVYQDQKVQVEARTDGALALADRDFEYERYDEDGDQIPNLDELRFGFEPRDVDGDPALPGSRVTLLREARRVSLGADDAAAALVERPVHEVQLQAYALDRREVSAERYRVCVARRLCAAPLGMERDAFVGLSEGSDLPAAGVRRDDAQAFCALAGGRLPTEAEWEYAARPDGRVYPWGSAIAPGLQRCDYVNARYYVSNIAQPCHTGTGNAAALISVGQFDPIGCAALPDSPADNHDGPCQMAGNVWEWTASAFTPYPGADWGELGEDLGALAVIRGGSADSLDFSLRASQRVGVDPTLAQHAALAPYVGFRCAYDPS